eukprot:1158309-Pelagomonas_calceolata.AAC.18
MSSACNRHRQGWTAPGRHISEQDANTTKNSLARGRGRANPNMKIGKARDRPTSHFREHWVLLDQSSLYAAPSNTYIIYLLGDLQA